MEQFHGTTIISVRDTNYVALGGDGQVSLGDTVMKGNAVKVRKLYQDKVLAGFAGSTADAFTLFERFEAQLEKHQGNLTRAAVELAKEFGTEDSGGFVNAMLRCKEGGSPSSLQVCSALHRQRSTQHRQHQCMWRCRQSQALPRPQLKHQ